MIAAKLGSGGEGTVYAVTDNPSLCVKIYHEQKRTPELELKIKAMIDAPPKDPTLAAGHYSICWPTHLVYEDEVCTKFLGFAMPLIDKKVFKEYHLLCDKPGASSSACYRLEHFGTGFTYLHMYVVALNLASCVNSIHEAGHAIGDLNDKNILVSTKDSKITIVDCDSFEIHGKDDTVFPCSVYMPEFSAPEVIKHQAIADRQKSDRFALAVLIFKLLMLNTHPFSSRGASVENLNTPAEKISAGYYPYEDHNDLDVSPPVYALSYDIIPPNIKALFRLCFVEGQHEPEKRPTVREWFIVLKENYEAMYAFVKKHEQMCDNNSLHIFPMHLTECPWCTMRDDYFPTEITTKQQKIPFLSGNAFEYMNNLIKASVNDGHLTHVEYEAISNYAKRNNISQKQVINQIDEFSNTYAFVAGEDPVINTPEIDFGSFNDAKITKNISITNNYLFSSLIITFKYAADYISVPHSFVVPPMQTKEIPISFIPEYISGKLDVEERITMVINSTQRIQEKKIKIFGKNEKIYSQSQYRGKNVLIDKYDKFFISLGLGAFTLISGLVAKNIPDLIGVIVPIFWLVFIGLLTYLLKESDKK